MDDTEAAWREVIEACNVVESDAQAMDDGLLELDEYSDTSEWITVREAAVMVQDQMNPMSDGDVIDDIGALIEGIEDPDPDLILEHIEFMHDVAMIRCAHHINGMATTIDTATDPQHIGFQ